MQNNIKIDSRGNLLQFILIGSLNKIPMRNWKLKPQNYQYGLHCLFILNVKKDLRVSKENSSFPEFKQRKWE